jgi:hypothetical protein
MRHLHLIALALLAGCGTTRLYEGAALPPDQAVRLKEWSSMWDSRQADLLSIDGREVERSFGSGNWELAPGPHVIEAQATMPTMTLTGQMGRTISGDRCRLSFTAEPGVTYELRTDESETHPPLNLQVVDTRNDAVVADNEPDLPEDCLSAEVDLGGGEWTVVQFHTNRTQTVAVVVPAGRTIRDAEEWIELQCRSTPDGPPDVDEVMRGLWESWKDSADDPETSVLARDEGREPGLVFTLRGDADQGTHCALVVLRTAGDRVHVLMWFKVTPDIAPANLALWRGRFGAARLYEPAAR